MECFKSESLVANELHTCSVLIYMLIVYQYKVPMYFTILNYMYTKLDALWAR